MQGSARQIELEADLALMRQAALEAGDIARAHLVLPMEERIKPAGDPVTAGDLAVNQHLHTRLLTARPGYGWLSEETVDSLPARRKERVFIVDPIDGTRAFIQGKPHFCICIARLSEGVISGAVIYAPMFDEMFEASLGQGSRLNGEPIRAASTDTLAGCRMIGDGKMFEHPAWPQAWPEMIIASPKPNAIAYRMALVAAGRWDAALALSAKGDWDLAAASLILTEAGGKATTHEGEDFAFNGDVPRQKSLIASTQGLHEALVQRVRHVRL